MTALETPQVQRWPARIGELPGRRALALGALALVSGLLGGDMIIHVIAVPRVAQYFAVGSATAWLAGSIGAVVLAACLLSVGALGDRFGRRRVLLGGVLAVAVGAVVTAYAQDSTIFLAGRAITGAGLAASFGTALAIVAALFPPGDLPRVFGVWLGIQSVTTMAAGVVGAALIDGTTWRTGYFLTGMVAVLLVVPGWMTIPDSRAATPRRLDPAGVLSASAALALLVGGIYRAAGRGWTDPVVLCALAGAAVSAALFAWWELRDAEPAVPLRRLATASFGATCLTGVLAGFAAAVVAVQTITALHDHRGLSVSMAMVVAVPLSLGMVLGADLAAQAQERGWATPALYVSGLICCGTGILALARVGAGAELWVYSAVCAVVGFGAMWAQNPQAAALMSALPADSSGVLAAVKTAVAQVGFALGLGVAAAMVAAFPGGAPAGSDAAYFHGFPRGMAVIGVLLLAGAVSVAVLQRPWALTTDGPDAIEPGGPAVEA
ncbi:MFS transporter [Nocardia wallacei]|uniref:MFS transporter n=1 Tax=Nocardia wallacei TaxID=480035 RepID=UPI00245553DC|nr:MFS transporter [Nocardia wallacei]